VYPAGVQYKYIFAAARPMPVVFENHDGSGNVRYMMEMKMNLNDQFQS